MTSWPRYLAGSSKRWTKVKSLRAWLRQFGSLEFAGMDQQIVISPRLGEILVRIAHRGIVFDPVQQVPVDGCSLFGRILGKRGLAED